MSSIEASCAVRMDAGVIPAATMNGALPVSVVRGGGRTAATSASLLAFQGRQELLTRGSGTAELMEQLHETDFGEAFSRMPMFDAIEYSKDDVILSISVLVFAYGPQHCLPRFSVPGHNPNENAHGPMKECGKRAASILIQITLVPFRQSE